MAPKRASSASSSSVSIERVEAEVALRASRPRRERLDGSALDRGDGDGARRSSEPSAVARPVRREHPLEDRPHLVALHLARRRARQRRVVEVHDGRALAEGQLVDAARRLAAPFVPRGASSVVASRARRGTRGARCRARRRRRPRAPARSDLAEARLDVVGVHVLAGRRDDDVLQAPDDREPPLPVELARGRPCGATPRRRSRARGLLVGVADHHVRPARDDLADAVGRPGSRS